MMLERWWQKAIKSELTWLFLVIVGVLVARSGWQAYQHWNYATRFTAPELADVRVNDRLSRQVIEELLLIQEVAGTHLRRNTPVRERVYPRNVSFKAHMVLLELTYLQRLKGVEVTQIPVVFTHGVSTLDVQVILRRILEGAKSLRVAYGVEKEPPIVSDRKGILPQDVYANLVYISYLIESLDEQAVQPSHVYRLAETLVWQAQRLAQVKELEVEESSPKVAHKSPSDVYRQSHRLLDAVHMLGLLPGHEIRGGVVKIKREKGHIRPHDVFNLLTLVVAEMGAIRTALGDQDLMELPPLREGKTPSDVFQRVNEALVTVEAQL